MCTLLYLYIMRKIVANNGSLTLFLYPLQETIERARIAEAFMNASSTAGLSENLDTLATLVDQEDNGQL